MGLPDILVGNLRGRLAQLEDENEALADALAGAQARLFETELVASAIVADMQCEIERLKQHPPIVVADLSFDSDRQGWA